MRTRPVLWLAAVWPLAGWQAVSSGQVSQGQSEQVTRGMPASPVARADAFFGLHFDLHPGPQDTSLGADITEENIEQLLQRVRPDWVQYDCKGHPGYTGYPTKIGWPSPGIVQDSLAIWRRVTRRHGVGLYIHYSGVWDGVAIEKHPDWARIDENGQPDPNATSVFGPYVDELLIPQLKEVTAAYELDAVWADGECWAAKLDYAPAALAAWTAETGWPGAPKKRDDPHWLEWKMFQRRAFEKYLCHWIDALHEFNPGLQLTSNWMYTTFAPKPIECRLDFLSGDFVPLGAVDRARLDARYLSSTGQPWDLMAWGFLWGGDINPSMKTAVQLEQEAAAVISQGGAFQVYYNPTRSGYISEYIVDACGPVADFCRARQDLCHRSTSIPQVSLLLSTEDQFDRSDAVFSPWGTSAELEGALHALLELHYSVDLLAEHQLTPRLSEYPLVVIPDVAKIAAPLHDALLEYVESGGNLLLLGEKCARLFEPALGVKLEGPPQPADGELLCPSGLVNTRGVWQVVTPVDARPIGYRCPTRDVRQGRQVAATLRRAGQGQIAAVFGPLGLQFLQSHHPHLRSFIGLLVEQVWQAPAVKLDAPPTVEIVLRRTRTGAPALHLINLSGQPQGNRQVVDFVPPVGPIGVEWRVADRPRSVRWLPDGDQPEWSWSDGILSVKTTQLLIHGALVLEQ